MTVRVEERREERRLIIDIPYTNPDGTKSRYRRDAQVQTLAAARAEDRRRLVMLAATGLPFEKPCNRVPAVSVPDDVLFRDVVGRYSGEYAPSRLKPSTRHGYQAVLDGVLLPRLGDMPLRHVDAAVVRKLDAELVATGLAPSTRRNVQIVLRSVLCRYAVEAGLLDHAPLVPALPKVGRTIVNVMTPEMVGRLLGACNDAHRRAFMLSALAGLRAGEIRGLLWRDIDLARGHLTVRESVCRGERTTPKSGHQRIVPLADALLTDLAHTRNRERSAPVSTNTMGGAWTESSLVNAFRRACHRAGLSGWRFHDLRHYFVTALFRAGTPAPTVQALAGHADLKTTQRYAHVLTLDLEDGIRKLTRLHDGNGTATPTASA